MRRLEALPPAFVALVVLIATVAFPEPASAHGQLAVSTPAHGGTLTERAETVSLAFTEKPSPYAYFTVTAPGGARVDGPWSFAEPYLLDEPAREYNLVNGVWEPRLFHTAFPVKVPVVHWPEQGIYTMRYQSVASDGGNDLNWTQVIIQCAQPWPYTCWGDIDRAEAFIRNNLPGLLDQLYTAIKAKAPNARIVAVGYPKLFNGQQCNVIARISPGEQARLNSAADLLATTTQARAAANGIIFVDARAAYAGHAVCDSVEWINGTSWPIGESYHPNRNGQQGYAGIVEAALRG